MYPILAGIAAGSAHVASGPDHLTALAPLAVASRLQALRIGAAWGIGHGAGVLLLGGICLLGRDLVNLESLSAWSELLVGGLLIWLGGWALFRSLRSTLHADYPADRPAGDTAGNTIDRRHVHGAFGVGFLHGAAGLGHLVAVVPSLAMTRLDAAQYLGAYLLGAIVTMALFGWALGLVSRAGGPRLLRSLFGLTGAGAVGLGCWWLVVRLV